MKVINTLEGWREFADKTLARELKSSQSERPQLNMEVSITTPLDAVQLYAFQYAFLECDRIESIMHRQCGKQLLIYLPDGQDEDAYRIYHYLYLIQHLRSTSFKLYIYVGKNLFSAVPSKMERTRFGRILPLMCIGTSRANPSIISYRDIIVPDNPELLQKRFAAAMLKSTQKNWEGDSTGESDLSTPIELLSDYYLGRLRKACSALSGTTGHPLQASKKKVLGKELEEVLLKNLPELSLLARIIWSCSLWLLVCSKKLLRYTEDNDWELDTETIQCSRLDAIAYAEGLQQLIENACIHSDSHRAYLSIRIHFTDITTSTAMKRGVISREALYNQISRVGGTPAGKKKTSSYCLAPDAKYCFEFRVINDAMGIGAGYQEMPPRGIAEMFYKREHRSWPPAKPYDLSEIFSQSFQTADDTVQHYGLRLLEKTVRLNGGYFCVSSPGKTAAGVPTRDIYQSFIGLAPRLRTRVDPRLRRPVRYTAFYILLPVTDHWHSTESDGSDPAGAACPLFIPESIGKTYIQRLLQLQIGPVDINGNPSYVFAPADRLLTPEQGAADALPFTSGTITRKVQTVRQVQESLERTAPWSENAICLLDLMRVQDYFTVELLAKALFMTIAKQAEGTRLYALLLPSKESIWEFIRIFSIFYDRLPDDNWMRSTQVALCSYSSTQDDAPIPEVNFLLAGATSASARVTARAFAYYNAGATLEMIPQLRYLTRNIPNEKESGVPQFPFDLLLTATTSDRQAEKSWFLRKMDVQLQSDLWKRPMGCRLHGIRVRLKSNVCLTDFYEAELLFHNVGVIYRFAYLITGDILRQLRKKGSLLPSSLVLVGYEFYSAVLIQQVAALLKGTHIIGDSVHYLICSGQAVSGEPLHLSPELQNMGEEERKTVLQQAGYIAIVPIGSTLSTLYHLQRTVSEQALSGTGRTLPLEDFENYVLILVGSVAEQDCSRLSDQYWKKDSTGLVTLSPQKNSLNPLRCRVYLEPQTHWQDRTAPAHEDPRKEEVLVYVDKTATLPKDIFIGQDTRFRGITPFLIQGDENDGEWKDLRQENDRRVELLKGCIHYGHLTAGNNHFQFYLDMDRYFARAWSVGSKRQQTITAWLETLRKDVEPNAYNIIVSPLHQEDSPFAKEVLDHVFEHSYRFLHADFASAFREDIRAKFSYVAEEYRQIRRYDSSRQVHVYFVNTAITSGNTLLRARNLIMMLLEESGISYDRGNVFKGCFVLVNRSGYDTLNSYVAQPLKNFHAYVHLAVPTFNVERDRCPTCELVERYRLIEERCATDQLRWEFHRLAEKHDRRDIFQYQKWLRNTIMKSCGYASWLRQWLFSYVGPAIGIKTRTVTLGIFSDVDRDTFLRLKQMYYLMEWGIREFLTQGHIDPNRPETDFEHQEDYLKRLNGFSLLELERLCKEKPEEARNALGPNGISACMEPGYWQQVVLDYICGQKNYLRLVTTHRAFMETETMPEEVADLPLEERGERTAEIMEKLIISSLNAVPMSALRLEWLISYLKVLSRPHLAQYHHIRQGSLSLLLRMVEHAIGENSEKDPPEFFSYLTDSKSFAPLLRYQLLQTILKRLAGIQSTYVLHREHMSRILDYVDHLRQEYFEETDSTARLFLPFPTMDEIRLAMTKLIKWTSSCGDDENGCFLIEREAKEVLDEDLSSYP